MDVATAFDDPRHRKSEELVFLADRHARAGNLDRARASYADAAEPELAIAREVTHVEVRSVFAVSGVTCFVRAQRWDDAIRSAHEFLGQPDKLTKESGRELEALLDDALRTRELFAAMGSGIDAAPLEIRLEGGRVRRGICPSSLVQEREEIAEALVFRVADYKAGRKFRKAGPSAFTSKFVFYEAPARAASYGIRFFVASAAQTVVPGVDISPRDTVGLLLELAAIVADTGPDGIRAKVTLPDYANAFIRAFRDLAPDGTAVTSVSLGSPLSLFREEQARFSASTRATLSSALVGESSAGRFSVTGTLKVVSLRKPWRIVVEQDDGATYDVRLRIGEHDDTIGPKLNRRVQVTGTRKQKSDGTVAAWAEDVVLVDDADGEGAKPDDAGS